MAPVVRPSTCTAARETRWIRARTPPDGTLPTRMPPENIVVPRFVAEPPQEAHAPHGRFAERLTGAFLAVARDLDVDATGAEHLRWFPDRTWHGRTYVPCSALTDAGIELYGAVSFPAGDPEALEAFADFTEDTAAANPGWQVDISSQTLGRWRGEQGHDGEVSLVWGRSLVPGAAVATAELGRTTVDQCVVHDDRFTLVALDAYRGDELDVVLWGRDGSELAREALYEDDDEDDATP